MSDAEIPRSDDGINATDQVGDRQKPDTAFGNGDTAVG
jgi:hypothetical protein